MTGTKFDFRNHKVVAVPFRDDDPEKGQHFHVDLESLINEIKAYVQEQSHADDGGGNQVAVITQPAIPDEISSKLIFIEKSYRTFEGRLEDLVNRVKDLEARPHLSSDDVAKLLEGMRTRFRAEIESQVAGAFGDVKSQLAVIRQQDTTVQQAPSGQINALAKVVRGLGDSVAGLGQVVTDVEESLAAKNAEMEMKYNAIAAHLDKTNKNMGVIYRVVEGMGKAINDGREE